MLFAAKGGVMASKSGFSRTFLSSWGLEFRLDAAFSTPCQTTAPR